jgi:dihydroorotate dehydrogenase (fumarate)
MGRAATSEERVVHNIIKTVKSASNIPIIGKLTPQGANPLELAKIMASAGADALVSTARFQGLLIDLAEMKPLLWDSFGGYGGPWQLPISLAWTAHIAKEVSDTRLIGSGGVSSGEDIAKFILVGADAVEVCTAIIVFGHEIIPKLINQLKEWMISKGFTEIEKFRGLILNKILNVEKLPREKIYTIIVDKEKCTGCKICTRVCPYGAISLDSMVKAYVDIEECDNCGLCVSLCPFNALELRRDIGIK